MRHYLGILSALNRARGASKGVRMWYYVDKERQQRGPVTIDQLKALLNAGEITKRTHLWQEGRGEWTRLEDLAASLGIAIAAPPPTPPPTAAMVRPLIQPIIAQPVVVQPPPVANAQMPNAFPPQPPAFSSAPLPPQAAYGAPPAPQPTFSVPQPGFANAMPVYTQTKPQSSGCGKYIFGAAMLGLLAVGALFKYAPGVIKFSTPTAKERLSELVSEMQPARAAAEEVYRKTGSCPDKDSPLPETVQLPEFGGYGYGALKDSGHCFLSVEIPANYAIKELASTEAIFVYEKFDQWTCGMSAPTQHVPKECDHFTP
jgi:GYF domain 2